jgi:hypothetical protein
VPGGHLQSSLLIKLWSDSEIAGRVYLQALWFADHMIGAEKNNFFGL